MSTLSTANIESKAANTPPVIKDLNGTECGQFARAWVNFDGTGTVAINDSFNVSSITDNGTGNYTRNFSTAMSNANYAYSCSRDRTGSQNGGIVMRTIATGTIRVLSFQENFASQDVDGAAVVVFGG